MKNIFQDIGLRRPRKSSFDLGHTRKFSFRPGILYPVFCHDAMPGDHFSMSSSALVRMMPMLAPMMHIVDCCSYTFRIPMRLLMQHGYFETFITGGKNGDGKDSFGNVVTIPHAIFNKVPVANFKIDLSRLAYGGLADFLGVGLADDTLATMGTADVKLNMMPFLAFWLTWNEYFRDQNLHPDYVSLYPGIFQSTDDGDITSEIEAAAVDPDNPFDFFMLPYVCWNKDMYTSALPFAQRGNPVETPLSGTATVTYKNPANIVKPGGASANAGTLVAGTLADAPVVFKEDITGDVENVQVENIEDIELTSGGFTINALRLAARLQEWLERMARGGARYVEQLLSMWGVVSSDARLQRPEYLAGGKMAVHISEVLQTGEAGSTPLGEMAGHGVSAGNLTGWSRSFEEHCIVMTFFFMRPQTGYQQGLPRLFTQRFDKLDWPWWQFANLGEQEVLNKEVYFNADVDDEGTFGYQQRLAEYKYIPSTVHGEFKNTLDFWHWGRIFGTRPSLSQNFVECRPDRRVFNVISENTDELYAIMNHKITAIRPLPYYGEPQL